ncbi:MAG: Gfo/Idh/MocA family oxidoreductase [Chloroflexi bacterium]|nr:Gfo/Idh/MocA family oxidoreductase [Chloroflexota bacterium]
MSLGWGFCGTGHVADKCVGPEVGRQPDSHVVAAFDLDRDRAREFSARHGGKAYDGFNLMLEDPDIDIVYVASPNAIHAQQVVAAFRAGKHVLCEKPMALSLDDGREMVSEGMSAGKLLGMGFHFRHKPSNVLASKLISDGRIGRVFFAEVERGSSKDAVPHNTWRQKAELAGGGSIFNQGLHTIDTLRFVTGKNIVAVSAKVDRMPIDDVFAAVLTLEDGVIATVMSHQLFPDTRPEYVVIGEEGWIRGRGAPFREPNDAIELYERSGQTVFPGGGRSPYWYEVDDFAKAVLGQAPLSGDGKDGLQAIAVVEAIYRSIKENRTVDVEPNW